jgi:hypothetical protein
MLQSSITSTLILYSAVQFVVCKRRYHFDEVFFYKLPLFENCVLLFWKLLVFEFLLGI